MKKATVTCLALTLGLALAAGADSVANADKAASTDTAADALKPAGDAVRGKQYFTICVTCHGANGEGNAILHAPLIGGQEVWYLQRQLEHFRSGIRGTDPHDAFGAQMRPMSLTLPSDQAVADVAAYVGTLRPPRPAVTVKGDIAAGKTAFAICVACHGPKAEGNIAFNAPRLKGQHDWYVVQQLTNFRAGIRGTKPKDTFGMQMRPMSLTLPGDAAVKNVAAFIATLK